jgi:hypothetical protein
MYNSVELVQVVRVSIVKSGGLYVATSADIPPMQATAFDLPALQDAVEDAIGRYFYSAGEEVHISLPKRRDPEDLSTWFVAPANWYREAAE